MILCESASVLSYLFRWRNLQLGFFWSFDHHDGLLLEDLKPADVFMGHERQREERVKESS